MSEGWERRQERTRAGVLAAAGHLIATSGVEGLTMRKLADRAGVSVGTLYNQFGDRNGVLVAFVGRGLDELERQLAERPAVAPIDSTRELFAELDRTLEADGAIWRPLFAALGSTPDAHGLGAVGDRVVLLIEQDFAKAAADGRFAVDVDLERLARHIFVTRMSRIQRWAEGVIDWGQYRSSSVLGLELILAAVLDEPGRAEAIARSGIVH